jgi:hypothetical protein
MRHHHRSSIKSVDSNTSNSSDIVGKRRSDSVRLASHRSSLRKIHEQQEKEARRMSSSSTSSHKSWQKTIRKNWKSSSSLSSMTSGRSPVKSISSEKSFGSTMSSEDRFTKKLLQKMEPSEESIDSATSSEDRFSKMLSQKMESQENVALEMVNSILQKHDGKTPIVYRQIKMIVTDRFDSALFDRIKPQVQEMLYLFTKKGETFRPTPRYKPASAMALCTESIVQGTLYKRTKWTGKWNKRYFQLDCLESRVRYWKTEQCPSDNDLCACDSLSSLSLSRTHTQQKQQQQQQPGTIESSFRNFQVTEESKPKTYVRNPGSDLPWAFAVKLWEPKSNGYKQVHLAALSPSEHWDWVNAFEKASKHWINTSKSKDSSSSILSSPSSFLAISGKSFFANLLRTGSKDKRDSSATSSSSSSSSMKTKNTGTSTNNTKKLTLSVMPRNQFRRKRKSPLHSLNKFVPRKEEASTKQQNDLNCFGVSLDKVRVIKVPEQSEPVPVVLAFLAHLLRAPIPAEDGRPHLIDGLMFPHLFRQEPEETLKENAMRAIDKACSYDECDTLNDMNIRLRDIDRSLAFNRPLLAAIIKIYLAQLPSKLLEKVESRLVASVLVNSKPPYKSIPPKIMRLVESLEEHEISVLKWLLRFLADVASKSEGMDVKAVAICLSPVMFEPIPIDMSNPTESIRLQTSFVTASSGLLQWLIETQYKDRFVVDPDPLL